MERVCFTMTVATEHLATYERMHAEAWPELLVELDRTGWTNYSLFLRDDGLLVGYLETPDWAAATTGMAQTEVSPRWSIEMDKLVVPGSTMSYLTLVHHEGNVSIFEREDGLTVVYADAVGSSIPRFMTADGPMREVFNLERQLARIER